MMRKYYHYVCHIVDSSSHCRYTPRPILYSFNFPRLDSYLFHLMTMLHLHLPHCLKVCVCCAEPSSASNLAKVPSIHGQQVTQIAAGTEHSALVTGKRPFIPESKNVRSAAARLTAFCCIFCQRAERCSPGAGESMANWDWAILVIRWFLRE